jgi:hypothetical protein
MAKKILWIVVIIAAILVLISLGTNRTENVTVESPIPIKIGAVLSLTGDAAPRQK